MPKTTQYNESSIRILEGLEPVKTRPAMYTRTESPLHIVQEVLDNAVDEALGGFATRITIDVLSDREVQISDNGRGIPVGMHPEKKIPVVQAVFTILHAGGKFDKASGGAYSYSGGLHGVGVSVTNALSDLLEVKVAREGAEYLIAFSNGDVAVPLKKLGKSEQTGTSVRIQPNPKYFDSPLIDIAALRSLAKSKAVLLPGLQVAFIDHRQESGPIEEVFQYTEGLVDYLGELSGPAISPILSFSGYVEEGDEQFAPGEGAAWAIGFYETPSAFASFVNLIPTPQGGTHVAGLRSALFNAVRGYVEHHGMATKGLKLTADDAFKNVGYVLSAKVLDPSFESQTKNRLNSRDAVKLLERVAQPFFEGWMNQNPAEAKAIAELTLRNAAARTRQSTKTERKKGSGLVMLPGKLSDCESSDSAEAELFLVEGDSAGGSAKMGRNKENQAILPLRGKGLNVWEKDAAEAMANTEIHDISVAIGVSPHKLGDPIDLSRLRYGRINILSDADVDGFHIQVLLLTLFLKHFPELVRRGHIFISKPPLYRLDAEAVGKKKPERKLYAMDDEELKSLEERLRKEGYHKFQVGRFKGLGEMDPPELWDTTLNPDTRRLYRVDLPESGEPEAVTAFDNLMSKAKPDWRRQWMERRGHEVLDL